METPPDLIRPRSGPFKGPLKASFRLRFDWVALQRLKPLDFVEERSTAVGSEAFGHLGNNEAKQDRDDEEQPFRSLIPPVRLFRLGRVRLGIVLLVRLHAPSYTKQAHRSPRTRASLRAVNAATGANLSSGRGHANPTGGGYAAANRRMP